MSGAFVTVIGFNMLVLLALPHMTVVLHSIMDVPEPAELEKIRSFSFLGVGGWSDMENAFGSRAVPKLVLLLSRFREIKFQSVGLIPSSVSWCLHDQTDLGWRTHRTG